MESEKERDNAGGGKSLYDDCGIYMIKEQLMRERETNCGKQRLVKGRRQRKIKKEEEEEKQEKEQEQEKEQKQEKEKEKEQGRIHGTRCA